MEFKNGGMVQKAAMQILINISFPFFADIHYLFNLQPER